MMIKLLSTHLDASFFSLCDYWVLSKQSICKDIMSLLSISFINKTNGSDVASQVEGYILGVGIFRHLTIFFFIIN